MHSIRFARRWAAPSPRVHGAAMDSGSGASETKTKRHEPRNGTNENGCPLSNYLHWCTAWQTLALARLHKMNRTQRTKCSANTHFTNDVMSGEQALEMANCERVSVCQTMSPRVFFCLRRFFPAAAACLAMQTNLIGVVGLDGMHGGALAAHAAPPHQRSTIGIY